MIRMKEWTFQTKALLYGWTTVPSRLGDIYCQPALYRWKHKRTGQTQPAKVNAEFRLLPPDDSETRLKVHCDCGEVVYDLAIWENGGVLEPDSTTCKGCGAEIWATVNCYEHMVFYMDDGEFEDVLDVEWPEWAVEAFENRGPE